MFICYFSLDHQLTLSHFKTYRINCNFYESFHFMTINFTCVVFLVVTAAHSFHEVFPPKIGRGQFKTRPKHWAKISRGLFLSQRNCTFIQTFWTYLSRSLFKPRLIFARINGPNMHEYTSESDETPAHIHRHTQQSICIKSF